MEPLLEDPGEFPSELSTQHISNSNPSLHIIHKMDQQKILSSSASCLKSCNENNDELKVTRCKKTKEDRLKKAVGRVLIALTFKRKPGKILSKNPQMASKEIEPIGCHKIKQRSKEVNTALQLAGSSKLDEIPEARTLNRVPGSFDVEYVIPPAQIKAKSDFLKNNTTHYELPSSYLERRKAIFDMTGFNDSDSCSTTTKESCNKRERKQSSADLGVNYPGDLLSQVRPRKKPLTSRNTIADFAASRVRQTSTISLLSATEQDKKSKAPFSLIKRGHSRSKDGDLVDILQNLKRSEFKDDFLEKFKKARWYNLLSTSKPKLFASTTADDDYEDGDSSDDIRDRKEESEAQMFACSLRDVERKRREAVWELFTSECIFLIDHLMVLKHRH